MFYYSVPVTGKVFNTTFSNDLLSFNNVNALDCGAASQPVGLGSTGSPFATGAAATASTTFTAAGLTYNKGPEIIVACRGTDQVKVFTVDGTEQASFNLPAGSHPQAIAVCAPSRPTPPPNSQFMPTILVTCPGTNQIVAIANTVTNGTTDNFVKAAYTIPTLNSQPYGIDSELGGGAVWFTEKNSTKIGKFESDNNGAFVDATNAPNFTNASTGFNEYTFPTTNAQPTNIAREKNADVFWFTEPGTNVQKIGRMDFNGNTIEYDVTNRNVGDVGLYGIGRGSDGNMWFTETNVNRLGVIATGNGTGTGLGNRGTQTLIRIQHEQSNPKGISRDSVVGQQAVAMGPQGTVSGLAGTQDVGVVNCLLANNSTLGEQAVTLRVDAPGFTGVNQALVDLAPSGIVEDSGGNVWVAQFYSNSVAKFVNGNCGQSAPIQINNGAFNADDDHRPFALCVGPDGNIWGTENQAVQPPAGTNGNNIFRITPAGVVTEFPIPTANCGATSICVGPDNNLWFCENASGKIGRCTTAGVITEFAVGPTTFPQSICAGPDGKLWFTEQSANKIGRITTAGVIDAEFSTGLTAACQPYGIAQGPDGAGNRCLWFTEKAAGKVGRITTAGTITEIALAQSTCGPGPIAEGSDGNMWFTELFATFANPGRTSASAAIGAIRPASTNVAEFPMQTIAPGAYGICAGANAGTYMLFTQTNRDVYGRVDFNF